MPSKVSSLKSQLQAAEQEIASKEQQLELLKQQASLTRRQVQQLEANAASSAKLDQDVQVLLQHQQETASAFKDYENRVLALELQGLVERWRAMDIEELAEQNHELRAECMRLQQENMELSRAVSEGGVAARRDLARIELALELTVKDKMRAMHDTLREELYEQLDDTTKQLVSEHGALQDHMSLLASQATALDAQYRTLHSDRAQYKVDADVAQGLSEQQAQHAVALKRQLRQAYQAIDLLKRRLEESDARAQAAWEEAVRAGSRAAALQQARAGGGGGGGTAASVQVDGDGDSAYGLSGEEAEIAALGLQLRRCKQRYERMRLQRDKWRDRSILYEKACAQLQAALSTLQDQSRLQLPSGVQQDLESIWSAARQATVDMCLPPTPTDATRGSVTPTRDASKGSLVKGAWEAGDGRQGQHQRPMSGPAGSGAAAAAAAAAMGRSLSLSSGGRFRPQTARAAGPGAMRSTSAAPALRFGGSGPEHGGDGSGPSGQPEAITEMYEGAVYDDDDDGDEGERMGVAEEGGAEGGARGRASGSSAQRASLSPPGRVGVSRLYSSDAEPFRVVTQTRYDRPGWPVTLDVTRTSSGRTGWPAPGNPPPRRPGSVRPHSVSSAASMARPFITQMPLEASPGAVQAPVAGGNGGGGNMLTAAEATDLEWQAWQAGRSPDAVSAARYAAAQAAELTSPRALQGQAEGAGPAAYGRGSGGQAMAAPAPAPAADGSRAWPLSSGDDANGEEAGAAGSEGVPVTGLSGGALYAVAHRLTSQGLGEAPGLLPDMALPAGPALMTAPAVPFANFTISPPSTARSADVGAGAAGRPASSLPLRAAASPTTGMGLRRPQSAFQRQSGPDVMFSGGKGSKALTPRGARRAPGAGQ